MTLGRCRLVFAVLIALCAAAAHAQNLTIYDDALQNGFLDYSYGGVPSDINFNATAQVHSGTKSISFIGDNYNALSFARPATPVSTAQYSAVHFWVHGGATGGQHIRIYLQLADTIVAQGVLDGYISGGSIAANTWREVTVNFSQAPLSYAGSFDRIDLQSDADGAQPVVYYDDVALTQSAPPPASAMQIEHDVNAAGMLSDRFTWLDSSGDPRVAVLAHNDAGAGPGGVRGGALREFRYKLPDGTTRIAGVTNYGNGGYAGFGYVVAHSLDYPDRCVGDDSPLGAFIPGTWQRIFEGRHHAIFRFTQNYPRNCSHLDPIQARTMPVTIDWVFSTGHDHPLWAVTWHVDLAGPNGGVNMFYDDARGPYGELNIDGDGSTDIDGVAWGDRYKFTSTSAPVTLDSTWTWDVANSVPYVKLWINDPIVNPGEKKDATMGVVQTQTMTQQDAGGGRDPNYHDMTQFWGKTSDDGPAGDGYTMPWQGEWPYQANAFSIGPGVSSNNARLTWRTQWGFLGQSSYVVHDGVIANAPGYPKKSYSTYVVLGTHLSRPVEAQVAQIETIQTLTLSATTGTVVTSGPAGVGRADTVTYAPAGYNHVYGALAFNAAGNQLDANIAVGAGTLKKPMLIIGNYTAGFPQTVRLRGTTLVADVDYFASLRASNNELWITLNRDLTGATNRVEILTTPPPPGANITSATKTVAGAFYNGGSIVYTIVLTNSGPSAQADNAGDEFTDVLPASLALVSADATGGTVTTDIGARTVHWNGSIAAGASVSISIAAQIASATAATITNQGTAYYDSDGNGSNESSRVTDDPATTAANDATSFNVGSALYIVNPCRLIDTRLPNGPLGGPALGPNSVRLVQAAGNCGVPADAKSVVTNLTAVGASSNGWLTAYPGTGLGPPVVSTLNYRVGKTRANNATITLSADGKISVYNSGPYAIHFIVDVNGYFK